MVSNLPTGTLTFLFTDLENSTQLWEQHPEAMKTALAQHDAILREAVVSWHGHVIKATGDGVLAVFASAWDALNAVLVAQRHLQTPLSDLPIRARMALHSGEAELRGDDYFGPAVNRTARLMAVAAGGQMLLSAAAAELVKDSLPADKTLRDLGEHRLKDLVRPEHIFQLVVPDLPADFPPLKSLDSFPNNLPVQLTSFVGREREMAEARQLLSAARLLTLIGPGGTGKTRLALQVGADLLPSFADGVWLVELAPLADPGLILQTFVSTFDLRELPGVPLIDLVTDYVRAKHMLLILDNCEHLVEACAQLADQLLRAGSQLKMIASSREALGIAGETIYRVPSLSLPEAQSPTLAAVSQCEAAQLFVERAVAAQPHFALTEHNAPAVAQICQRLDGIPLAIELAAARAHLFAPEQIAARLDDRFRLLTGGSRTALPRQQTLRALIDWSYDLLPDPERVLFRRLSVFAGGWTFEAAEAVCSDLDVLDLLTQLVNKSLVVAEDHEGGSRYRFLETVRQYAREKLLESGEAVAVRHRHLDFFLQYVEQVRPKLFGAEMLVLLDRLEAEHDNLRAALEWALESQPEIALQLVGALGGFWNARSEMTEARTWCQAALTRAEKLPRAKGKAARARTAARAAALSAMAWAAITQGDHRAGRAAAEEGVTLARQAGDSRTLARLLSTLALAAAFLGDLASALAAAQESETISRQRGYKAELGFALGSLTTIATFAQGDGGEAQAYLEEGLALTRGSGIPWASAISVFSLARLAAQRGDIAAARQGLEEVTAIFQKLGDRRLVNASRSELAHNLRRHAEFEAALALYRETIGGWRELGHRAAVAHELECFALIAGMQGKAQRAVRLFGAAEALRDACGSPMTPPERVEYDQGVSQLRARMDEAAFAAAWAEGRAMAMEDAITYALKDDTDD